jgi:IS5 family transposase
MELLLQAKAVKRSDLERVTEDTTVQEKAIGFPTDARLYNRTRERLVRLARQHGVPLRQSYARVRPRPLS